MKGWGKCSITRGWENVTLQGDREMRYCNGVGKCDVARKKENVK